MDLERLVALVLVVIALVAIAIAAMAVGVMFKRPCLRGSCGGPGVHRADGEAISCTNCPNRERG